MQCLIAPKCDHMENRMHGARLARRGIRGIVSFVAPWVPLLGAVGAAMQVHAPCAARPRSSVHNSPRVFCEVAAHPQREGLCVGHSMASIMPHATAKTAVTRCALRRQCWAHTSFERRGRARSTVLLGQMKRQRSIGLQPVRSQVWIITVQESATCGLDTGTAAGFEAPGRCQSTHAHACSTALSWDCSTPVPGRVRCQQSAVSPRRRARRCGRARQQLCCWSPLQAPSRSLALAHQVGHGGPLAVRTQLVLLVFCSAVLLGS